MTHFISPIGAPTSFSTGIAEGAPLAQPSTGNNSPSAGNPVKAPRVLDCNNPYKNGDSPCKAMPPLWRYSPSRRMLDYKNPYS